jgi:AcrR family transcriptional regulator
MLKKATMRQNAAQQRIFDAAVHLFAERGVVPVNVSELAQFAGIARGTIYNNIPTPETLFEDVAAQLGMEMHQRVVLSFGDIEDPAQRLANGIRHFVRRAQEDRHWGQFVVRFSFSSEALRGMWAGPPAEDLLRGLDAKRYTFDRDQLMAVTSMIAGTTLTAMFTVLDGLLAWRDAGSNAAALALRALGLPHEEADAIARLPLPDLPEKS